MSGPAVGAPSAGAAATVGAVATVAVESVVQAAIASRMTIMPMTATTCMTRRTKAAPIVCTDGHHPHSAFLTLPSGDFILAHGLSGRIDGVDRRSLLRAARQAKNTGVVYPLRPHHYCHLFGGVKRPAVAAATNPAALTAALLLVIVVAGGDR